MTGTEVNAIASTYKQGSTVRMSYSFLIQLATIMALQLSSTGSLMDGLSLQLSSTGYSMDGLSLQLSSAGSSLDELTGSKDGLTPQLDSSLLEDGQFTTQEWTGLLDSLVWPSEQELFAAQQSIPGPITMDAQRNTDKDELNLSGLSDLFREIYSHEDNELKDMHGGSLSNQLQDEPGLYEALKDLGFEDQIFTGKYCSYVHLVDLSIVALNAI